MDSEEVVWWSEVVAANAKVRVADMSSVLSRQCQLTSANTFSWWKLLMVQSETNVNLEKVDVHFD